MAYASKQITKNGVKPLGSNLFGVCTSNATTQTKTVAMPDFDVLVEGVTIHVYFQNTNQASNPLLKVGSTEAKAIRYNGVQGGKWEAGGFFSFTFYQDFWVMNDFQPGDDKLTFYRKIESYYTTTNPPEQTIPININNFTADDMLIVDINGLTLADPEDYVISGNNIVLTLPIQYANQTVHFIAMRAVNASASDYALLKGDPGDPAGFGTPTASVDDNVGTPSVVVTASGPDTAKVFDFDFHNLKGQKGDTGNGISNAVLNADYTLTLTFTDGTTYTTPPIRGAQGPQGIQGVSITSVVQTTTSTADEGINEITVTLSDGTTSTFQVRNGSKGGKGDTGDAAGFGTVSATVDANVGTPTVNVTTSGPDTAKNIAFAFSNLKGQKGDAGVVDAYPRTGETPLSAGWLSETAGGASLTPQSDQIYILMANSGSYLANTTYRWNGTTYEQLISPASGLIDMFYPIGSYYETSDGTFDPNISWGGTWILEASGQVHISAGTGYTLGDTGGAISSTVPTTTLSDEQMAHGHEFTQPTVNKGSCSITSSGGHSHAQAFRQHNNSGSGSAYVIDVTTNANKWSWITIPQGTGPGAHTHTVPDHTHSVSGGAVSNLHGASNTRTAHGHGSVSTLQPYVVVNRWHRTA